MGDGGDAELIASQDEPHREELAIAHALADEEEEQRPRGMGGGGGERGARSKVNPGSPAPPALGQPWVPDFWRASVGPPQKIRQQCACACVLVLHRGVVTVSSAGPRGLFKDLGLRRSYSAVTVSSAGPTGLFKGMTTATLGVIARFPLLLPVRNSVASYGASAVARTSDRGHVAEVGNHRSGGVPPLMSTCAVSSKHRDAEHRPHVVWMVLGTW